MYDPTTFSMIRCDSPVGGWNCDLDVVRLRHAIATERQFEKRYRLWQAIQQLFWERVLGIQYGHVSSLTVMHQRVHGPFDMRCPTWPCQAGDEPCLDGMGKDGEDDRDRRGRVLGGEGANSIGAEHVYRELHQCGRQLGQSRALTLGKLVLQVNVVPLDVAEVA